MAIQIKHPFVSPKSDGGDSTVVQPSNWNASHTLEQATDRLLGRVTAGSGATEELTKAQTRTFLGVTDGNRNILINGAFDVWQRGTSGTRSATQYTADRWAVSGAGTFSRSTDVPADEGLHYSLTYRSDDHSVGVYQAVENGIHLVKGRSCRLNARVKGPSGKTAYLVVTGSTAVQYTFTGSWQTVEATFSVPSGQSGDHLYVFVNYDSAGTSTEDHFATKVQLEIGSTTTDFEHRSFARELQDCLRYYCEIPHDLQCPSVGLISCSYSFPVPMRTVPTRTNVAVGTTSNATIVNEFGSPSVYGGYFQIQATTAAGYTIGRRSAFSAEI
jgi:hypothetical protein